MPTDQLRSERGKLSYASVPINDVRERGGEDEESADHKETPRLAQAHASRGEREGK
jgi:hypothetical protein